VDTGQTTSLSSSSIPIEHGDREDRLMFKNARTWWVPVGSFALALLLSLVTARPQIAFSLRQQGGSSGEQCCHIARIKPVDDFVVELKGSAFKGISSWQLGFSGNHAGRLAAEGSARNGFVTTPDIEATVRIRLKEIGKKEPCKHRAHAEGNIEVRWSYAVPGTADTGPFPVNSTGCHLRAEMDTRLESDLGAPEDHNIDREVIVENTANAGLTFNVSSNPGVGIPFSLKLGKVDRSKKDADLERMFFPFDEQCDFRLTSRLEFNVHGDINLTSITAAVAADIKTPLGLTDRDEPVYARFTSISELPVDFVLKTTCDSPEERVSLPVDTAFDKRIEGEIKSSPKPSKP
jgi:hypothetical protein